ncbi:MAG: SEC-C metal-binding domain-containing protein, partial [Rickettsia sp.]
DVSLEHKKLQKNMQESREDPAFSKYNAGSSIETDLKPVISRIDPKARNPEDPTSWGRVSRNEPCPCGSGKKYKYCHGANE